MKRSREINRENAKRVLSELIWEKTGTRIQPQFISSTKDNAEVKYLPEDDVPFPRKALSQLTVPEFEALIAAINNHKVGVQVSTSSRHTPTSSSASAPHDASPTLRGGSQTPEPTPHSLNAKTPLGPGRSNLPVPVALDYRTHTDGPEESEPTKTPNLVEYLEVLKRLPAELHAQQQRCEELERKVTQLQKQCQDLQALNVQLTESKADVEAQLRRLRDHLVAIGSGQGLYID